MRPRFLSNVPRNVLLLGIVSLLTDVSSEMIYPVVPLFLTAVLGAPMTVVGFIEGAADFTANALKPISGWLADRTGRPKPWIVTGYGLSALSKALLALASAWPTVLGARVLDRVGKGIRTAPRDALIAAASHSDQRGRLFGLHRALDTTGAVLGPLVAALLLSAAIGYRWIFVAAVVPAALGVALLAAIRPTSPTAPASPSEQPALGTARWADYWRFLRGFALFSLGNSSAAFLILRARNLGLSQTATLMAYVLYNLVYALGATPAGRLSDRVGRRAVLSCGMLIFAAVYFVLATALSPVWIWLLFAAYGLSSAATDGTARAWVADLAAASRRSTALGIFHAVAGFLGLMASLIAGWLWARFGPRAPFAFGAVCALAGAMHLGLVKGRPETS